MISVILPVYNVSLYLKDCLDSLINQDFNDYEIIAINDGSTDSSLEILESYKFSKLKIYTIKNSGQSNARNFGVSVSNGKYIVFVDSDDKVSKSYLSTLFSLIKENPGSIGVSGYTRIEKHFSKRGRVIKYSKKQALEHLFSDNIIPMNPWGKIYPRNLILDNPFPKNRYYEDMMVMDQILSNCEWVFVSKKKTYFYRKNQNSIMKSSISKRKIDDMNYINSILLKRYNNTCYMKCVLVRVLLNNILLIRHSKKSNDFQLTYSIKYTKKHYRDAFAVPSALKTRIAALLCKINYQLLRK